MSGETVTVDRELYEMALRDAIACYRETMPGHFVAGCCTPNAQCERWAREAGRYNSYREALEALDPIAPGMTGKERQ